MVDVLRLVFLVSCENIGYLSPIPIFQVLSTKSIPSIGVELAPPLTKTCEIPACKAISGV
jgi:hypothetical protein